MEKETFETCSMNKSLTDMTDCECSHMANVMCRYFISMLYFLFMGAFWQTQVNCMKYKCRSCQKKMFNRSFWFRNKQSKRTERKILTYPNDDLSNKALDKDFDVPTLETSNDLFDKDACYETYIEDNDYVFPKESYTDIPCNILTKRLRKNPQLMELEILLEQRAIDWDTPLPGLANSEENVEESSCTLSQLAIDNTNLVYTSQSEEAEALPGIHALWSGADVGNTNITGTNPFSACNQSLIPGEYTCYNEPNQSMKQLEDMGENAELTIDDVLVIMLEIQRECIAYESQVLRGFVRMDYEYIQQQHLKLIEATKSLLSLMSITDEEKATVLGAIP